MQPSGKGRARAIIVDTVVIYRELLRQAQPSKSPAQGQLMIFSFSLTLSAGDDNRLTGYLQAAVDINDVQQNDPAQPGYPVGRLGIQLPLLMSRLRLPPLDGRQLAVPLIGAGQPLALEKASDLALIGQGLLSPGRVLAQPRQQADGAPFGMGLPPLEHLLS